MKYGIIFILVAALVLFGLMVFKPPSKTVYKPSETPASTSDIVHSPNYAKIDGFGSTTVMSPDGALQAHYYYVGPTRYEGDPTFNYVEVTNLKVEGKKTYPLQGPIPYAADAFFWSPVNNKIYFTHITNGVGIYELWMSDIDGSNAVRYAGFEHTDIPKDTTNEPVGGETDRIAYSPNGKLIATAKVTYSPIKEGQIWVMNYDGSNPKKIVNSNEYRAFLSLDFESDNKHLQFAAVVRGKKITYRTDISGTPPQEVSEE